MELDEIDSPSDFVHLSFSTLDSTLRCPICKSLFLAPVSFSTCFHTFCSKCIRFNLASKEGSSTCPSCGIGVDDGKLKVNPVVGQIVEAYREGRGKLLQLEKATTVGAKKKIGKVKRKTKGDDGDSSDVEIIEPEPSTSKLQSSKGKQKQKTVICPLCNLPILLSTSSSHVESCSSVNSKSAWNQLLDGSGSGSGSKTKTRSATKLEERVEVEGEKWEKLPVINYDGKTLKALKALLDTHSLPTTVVPTTLSPAEKLALLKTRHKHYTVLHNSNCDLPHPRKQGELRKELREWEDVMRRDEGRGKKEREKVGEGGREGWLKDNSEVFRELIEKARPKPKVKSTSEKEKEKEKEKKEPTLIEEIEIDDDSDDEDVPPQIPSPNLILEPKPEPEEEEISPPRSSPPKFEAPSKEISPPPSSSPPPAQTSIPLKIKEVKFLSESPSSKKRSRSRSRSSSFDPEGPKPSQRVRDDFWGTVGVRDEDEDGEESESDGDGERGRGRESSEGESV